MDLYLKSMDIPATGNTYKIVQPDGYYPDMTAGQITTNIHESDSVPYVFRPTPYNSTRESGDIVGASVAWNQLLKVPNGSKSHNGITASFNSTTGVISLSGTASSTYAWVFDAVDFVSGHKYLRTVNVLTNPNNIIITTWANRVNWTWTQDIFSCNASGGKSFGITGFFANDILDGITLSANFVDLTLAFPSAIADYIYTLESGTAGAGIAKLREWGFFTKPYYAYNAGGIESVNVSKHIMRDGDDNIIGEYPLDPDLTLRGFLKLDGNNNLYADGDVYHPDGTVDRNWAERAYEAGDVSDGSTMITDGTTTVYKLQTPTTETADPYNEVQVCSPYGTEEFVDAGVAAGTRDVAIPCGHNTEYMKNIVGAIEGIPLPPTTNGNWRLRCTVASGVPTYSWISE